MRVLIRADASTQIGSGHVVRTRTLASELTARGAEVTYACRQLPGDSIAALRSEGFSVISLPAGGTGNADLSRSRSAWPQHADAVETIAATGEDGWNLIVADHYALGEVWEQALRPYATKVMAIDDLANRKHDCDLLLDQSLAGRSDRYAGLVPEDCRQLLGLRYALLKREYAQARERLPRKTGRVSAIVVFFGGSDEQDFTGQALAALSHPSLREVAVDVVVGANYRHQDALERQATVRGTTRVHRNLPHLADLLGAADLAIGGGGTTNWERLCLGLPSLVVSVADNQTANCLALEAAGLIQYLGTSPTLEDMHEALDLATASINQMRENARRGQRLVDGLGARRVAEILLPSRDGHLSLRRATPADMPLFFNWANDPGVRANSLQTDEITWDEHVAWYYERLRSNQVTLHVLQAHGLPLGQIRVEECDGAHWLSYSLDPIARGRGWGRKLVELGCQAAHKDGASAFRAKVKQANLASAALLLGLGFEELPPEGDIRIFQSGTPNGPQPHMRERGHS